MMTPLLKPAMINLFTIYPTVQIVTATKKLVDELLAINTHNRNAKQVAIDRLIDDLKNHAFYLTASGVGVSSEGVLIDGQHRLMAIRGAGYPPVRFVLATGLSPESQRVIDRHTKRNLADVLSLHMNITISTHVVALSKAIYTHGALLGKNEKFVNASRHQSDTDAAEFIAEHGDLLAEVVSASGQARAPVLAAFFVYALHDRSSAMEFCRDVAKGINLSDEHPAYRLRLVIEKLRKAQGSAGRMELFKIAATAVVSHANGRTLKMLKESESWTNAPWKWAL
jgi:hypothetical protein